MIKEKIKFPAQQNPDFINELRTSVKEYFEKNNISKSGDSIMVLKAIFMFSIYLVPYILMITGIIQALPLIFICWVIMGVGMAGVGMGVMHDANHGTFSKHKKINKFMGQSLYLLGGFPETWKYQHNTLHHGYTNIDGQDEDIDPIGLMRFSPHKPLKNVHKFQYLYAWFFYGLMTLSWTIINDFEQLYKYNKVGNEFRGNQSFRKLFIKLTLSKTFYYIIFLIIPLIFISAPWYWIAISYIAMHFTAGFILSIIFQSAHVVTSSEYPLPDKDGNLENNWAIHQLLTTSDFAPKSKIFSWFVGGLNYQVEHHLFPNISHIHYKKLARLVKATALKNNLPYHVQPTFMSALADHAKMLKILGRQEVDSYNLKNSWLQNIQSKQVEMI